jgi:hypothetical protein
MGSDIKQRKPKHWTATQRPLGLVATTNPDALEATLTHIREAAKDFIKQETANGRPPKVRRRAK